ncbi:type II secretion system protein GspG, partial [Planctomycetota bacterium]
VLDGAITMFHNDTGRFPQGLDELIEGSEEGWDGPYIQGGMKALRDPWGNDYYYSYTGAGSPPYELGSYGSDEAPGGEGENKDIFPHKEE